MYHRTNAPKTHPNGSKLGKSFRAHLQVDSARNWNDHLTDCRKLKEKRSKSEVLCVRFLKKNFKKKVNFFKKCNKRIFDLIG